MPLITLEKYLLTLLIRLIIFSTLAKFLAGRCSVNLVRLFSSICSSMVWNSYGHSIAVAEEEQRNEIEYMTKVIRLLIKAGWSLQ